MLRILVLGATGQFGKLLCRRLCKLDNIQLIILARNYAKLKELSDELKTTKKDLEVIYKTCSSDDQRLTEILEYEKPNLLIHLAGPFQGQNYFVAQACINAGVSYFDIADGRDYVSKFYKLDASAREKNISLITGASTVPALGSAIIDTEIIGFKRIESVNFGISTGLKAGLGLATIQAVLSYCGKVFTSLKNGSMQTTYGFNNLRYYEFPKPVGRRLIADCNIPDLELYPKRYPTLKTISFGAGTDVPKLEYILKLLSHLSRLFTIDKPELIAIIMKPILNIMRSWGSPHSGFFMIIEGVNAQEKPKKKLIELIAFDGSGLQIPITPIILLIKRIAHGKVLPTGAYPCVGLFSAEEYEKELSEFPIFWTKRDILNG